MSFKTVLKIALLTSAQVLIAAAGWKIEQELHRELRPKRIRNSITIKGRNNE